MEMYPMFARLILSATLALGLGLPAAAERLTEAPLVDAAWLADHLDNPSLVVIDVRDPAQGADPYAQGHVPGALSAPYSGHGWREEVGGIPGMLPPVEAIAARIGALGVDGDSHVVIVPQGVDSTEFGRATRVYWTFKVLGHDAVSILDGGHNAWTAAGLPVETEAATATPASFTPAFRPELVADAGAVRAALENPVQLIDGRPEAQYRGVDKSRAVRSHGTVPGALNIPHGQLYDGNAFATPETVRALVAALGVGEDDPTITFCNTGHWASITWFALSEVAGRDGVAMYDGSMADWSRDPANPMVVLN